MVYVMMINMIQAFVQIILESLPVSSSGHLVLLQKVMEWPSLARSFEYMLHGPTIVMLMFYFRATWYALLRHCWRLRKFIVYLIFLTISTDVITVIVYGFMQWLGAGFPLSLGFLITMGMLFSVRWTLPGRQLMTIKKAWIIGFMQGIAGLPGISRLASTYVAGVWLGLAPHKSFYFSCMIQFPLICAGFLYGFWFVRVDEIRMFFVQPKCITFFVIATIIAYVLLGLVQRYMETGTVWKFGYYMLLPFGIALLI